MNEPLPAGWTWTTLGDAFSWGSGGTPKSTETSYYGGDIPWAIIGDLNDGLVNQTVGSITELGMKNSSAKWVEAGSVLLAMYGSIGKLGIAGTRLTTNQAIAFTNPASADGKYLFYYLMSIRNELMSLGKGGTQKNISQTVIKAVPFPMAPLPEQRRIVEAIETQLTRLDAAVAALKRAQANLKRYRASVLKAAVEGRLVPTEAELARSEGRGYESGEELLKRLTFERETALRKGPKWLRGSTHPLSPDPSTIRNLPEGWAVASTDQLVVHLTSGSRDWSAYYGRGSATFILAQNVRPGRLDLTFRQSVDPPPNDRDRQRSEVKTNDLLVTIVGANTGDVCRVPSDLQEHYVCQSVALMRPALREISNFMELFLISEENGQKQFQQFIYGQGRPHLSFDQLRATVVPLPPSAEQARIFDEVELRLSRSDMQMRAIEASLLRAEHLRQSILKRAFEGKLVPLDRATNT